MKATQEKPDLKVRPAYQDGYRTGLRWIDMYVPGGPLVFRARENESAKWKAECLEMQRDRSAYLLGWATAIAERLRAKDRQVHPNLDRGLIEAMVQEYAGKTS